MLFHFKTGISSSDWKKFSKKDEPLPNNADPDYLFNKALFLDQYTRTNDEALAFLGDFTQRPAFNLLIEMWIDSKDQVEIYLFKKRLG